MNSTRNGDVRCFPEIFLVRSQHRARTLCQLLRIFTTKQSVSDLHDRTVCKMSRVQARLIQPVSYYMGGVVNTCNAQTINKFVCLMMHVRSHSIPSCIPACLLVACRVCCLSCLSVFISDLFLYLSSFLLASLRYLF